MKVEGSNITINDSVYNKISIIPKGACEQDTTAYIDVGTWEQGFINDNGENVNSNYWVRTLDYIPVKSNILYNITRTISTEYMAFRFYNSEKTFIGTNETPDLITTNLPSNQNRMRAGDTSIEVTINNSNVAYMRMTDASNDLSTIYTISTQAPSPDYPQDIRVVTSNLPNEYQEVEYIESSGAQYIDTGFNGGNNYSIKFKIFDSTLSKFQFSDLNSSVANENIGWYSMSSSKYGVYHTSTNNVTNISTGRVIEVDLKLSSTGLSCIYKGEVTSINYTPVTTNGNVVLFRRGNLDQYYSSTKLYYFKIYNSSNVLVRDLVPCYRRSDNVIGLYDKANNVFYTNQGTGTFTKGKDVNKVVVQNKNLLSSIEIGGIDINTGDSQVSYSYARCDYIQVIGGETISVQYKDDSIERGQVVIYEYDKDKNFLGFHNGNAKTYSRTLLSNTAYIRLRLEGNNPSTLNEFYEYQVEYSETPTTYIAHAEQIYPIHLGTNYLAGIGDYKDEIIGSTNNWKIKRYVGKLVFDGSNDESWGNVSVLGDYYRTAIEISGIKSITNNNDYQGLSNRFIKDTSVITNINPFPGAMCQYRNTSTVYFVITQTNVGDFKAWLTSNNVILYYVLATPIEEPITDQTLITDLNNMYQAMGYDGTTNITITSDSSNAQMTVEVTYTSKSDMCEKLLFIFNKMKDKLYHIIRSL